VPSDRLGNQEFAVAEAIQEHRVDGDHLDNPEAQRTIAPLTAEPRRSSDRRATMSIISRRPPTATQLPSRLPRPEATLSRNDPPAAVILSNERRVLTILGTLSSYFTYSIVHTVANFP